MTAWKPCESSGGRPVRSDRRAFREGRGPRTRWLRGRRGRSGSAGGRRRYPELVFLEPAHDDREVYGDAWPLIEKWREIWKAGHRGTGRGLAWLRTEERVRTLEVAMLEEHGLTLPPEKMPLYGLDRRDQLLWRQKTLYDVRKSLAWAELRRALTFGLWRN